MSEMVVPEYVHEANAEKARAEAQKALAEASEAGAKAERAQIELAKARHSRDRELAGDEFHRTYRFVGGVGDASVKACMAELATWSRLDPGCAITIIFQSPGGAVIDGFALWDFLQEMRENGHHLTTIARGYAASMAGILLQAGDHRVMGKEAWLLIHEASFGAVGSYGDVQDTVKWIERIQKRIVKIFAARSKLSENQIQRRWHRTDWWIDSDEALKLGLVDEVR